MALIIVALGMHRVHRLGNARPLIEVARIGPEIGIIDNASDIALEVAVIDQIEAIERRPEPPVRLGGCVPGQETRLAELFVQPVERLK